MGRGGPISWPARSLDLSHCDLYFSGHINDVVYRDPPQTIHELKTKIRKAIRIIIEDTLKRVFENMKTSLKFVIREKGGLFKHVMN